MTSTHLRDLLRTLRDTHEILSAPCVYALASFIDGYGAANLAARKLVERTLPDVVGPAEANLFTRAYLANPSSERALDGALDALIGSVERWGEPEPAPGYLATADVVANIVAAIQAGQTALLVGNDPMIYRVHDFLSGFTKGLAVIAPDSAVRLEKRIVSFDGWVRAYFELDAAWYRLIRVHAGPCSEGLTKFVTLWDASERDGAVDGRA